MSGDSGFLGLAPVPAGSRLQCALLRESGKSALLPYHYRLSRSELSPHPLPRPSGSAPNYNPPAALPVPDPSRIKTAGQVLVDEALKRGSSDNITALVVIL